MRFDSFSGFCAVGWLVFFADFAECADFCVGFFVVGCWAAFMVCVSAFQLARSDVEACTWVI